MYIHGPGGVLRDSAVRRQRRLDELRQQQQQQRQQPSSSSSSSSCCSSSTSVNHAVHDNNDNDDNMDMQDEQAQLESLRNLDRHPALLLNADYQPMSWLPLSLWNWQEAVKAVFTGKVTVVDVYPDVTIRAANLEVPLPAVIALTEYVPLHDQKPAFTKRNVFLRDEYRCQYCNHLFHTRDLSLDHVVPRCKGGGLNWTNAVTSCRKCNGRKGSLDLAELRARVGMQLRRQPVCPTQYELAATASRMLPRRVHSTWEPYLGVQHQQQQHHHQHQHHQQHHQHHGKAHTRHAAAMEEEL